VTVVTVSLLLAVDTSAVDTSPPVMAPPVVGWLGRVSVTVLDVFVLVVLSVVTMTGASVGTTTSGHVLLRHSPSDESMHTHSLFVSFPRSILTSHQPQCVIPQQESCVELPAVQSTSPAA